MSRHGAVALDLDGTVADTMPGLQELAVGLFVERYGLPEVEACERYRETIGAPFERQLEQIFPKDKRNERTALNFRALKFRSLRTAQPFTDVREALRLLLTYGWVVFIVSSTELRWVNWFIERNHLEFLVTNVLGNEGGDTKAAQISSLVDELKLLPCEVTLIGDAPLDAEYARQAGVSFLAVTTTFPKEIFDRRDLPSEPSLLEAVRRLVYG